MGEKNNLLSVVVSDDVVNCVKHLVKYLSCRVFGQAMCKHVIYSKNLIIKGQDIYNKEYLYRVAAFYSIFIG